ncbi:TetR/AcrR family transcriptional regulator [Haloarchaeobius amylolyticus]|uniref:TetR/AcrR family transcriptional regulator n=1 Tax=Haloarchaeobius amylolyticus TaxID=1198296 RepID=UPI00226FAA5A|nr:TetR/AcrR family transcriptional regulator [Haloarchaeobius amylolyticus]
MSGGFSDAERERIRERLVAEGRELFSHYGLKKTTIADLTDPVGIATSTFYQFFDSKEALYVEILEREGEEMLPRIIAPFEEHDDPEAAIVGFLTELMDEIETNPLVRRLLVEPQELQMLRDYHTEEDLREDREESLAYFLPYVEAWYEAGEVEGPNPKVVANAIRSVSFLTLHQEDIGADLYPETRDLVIRAVARGLTE